MIYVIATIELESRREREVPGGAERIAGPWVHKEHGCIEYGPTVDVDGHSIQVTQRHTVVTLIRALQRCRSPEDSPHQPIIWNTESG